MVLLQSRKIFIVSGSGHGLTWTSIDGPVTVKKNSIVSCSALPPARTSEILPAGPLLRASLAGPVDVVGPAGPAAPRPAVGAVPVAAVAAVAPVAVAAVLQQRLKKVNRLILANLYIERCRCHDLAANSG